MGSMTFCAGAQGNRAMHERLLEWGAVMTTDAEFGLILANIQQRTACATVILVTGQTFATFDRRMHYFLLAKRVVALIAESRHPGHQFPTLAAQQRVCRIFLLVTRRTIFFLYRCMRLLRADNCLVT